MTHDHRDEGRTAPVRLTDRHDIAERLEEYADMYYGDAGCGLAKEAAALIREHNHQNCVAEMIAASVLQAFTIEVERRRELESALQTVLARITGSFAASWRARPSAPDQYTGTLADFIRATISEFPT